MPDDLNPRKNVSRRAPVVDTSRLTTPDQPSTVPVPAPSSPIVPESAKMDSNNGSVPGLGGGGGSGGNNGNGGSAAPPFLQGIRPLDPAAELAKATPEQISVLAHNSFALWSQFSGIEVDSRPFDFDKHRYLLPIYLDDSHEIAWIKSAQMGATIWEVLRLLWFCRYKTLKAGLYFPTQDGVNNLSKDRLGPIIRSIPELAMAVSNAEGTEALNLKQIRNINNRVSSLYMLYLGGTASKDSVPLDVVAFDELRLVEAADVDQALERISHSTYKYKMYVSTAGYPSCFAGDTTVVCRHKHSGSVLPVRMDLLLSSFEEYQVLSYHRRGGNRTCWRDIKSVISHGEKEVVRVSLWGGHEIVCTPDHRFAQLDKARRGHTFAWTPISDVTEYPKAFGGVGPAEGVLCVNEFAVKPNSQWNVRPEQDGPYDLLTYRVVGLFIAEGTLNKSGELQIWQNGGDAVVPYVVKWAKRNGLKCRLRKDGVFISLTCRQDLKVLFEACGDHAENKRIPEKILQASPKQLKYLVRGLVDGDGHVRPDGTFDYYTVSKTLVTQLRFVLMRLGVPAGLHRRKGKDNVSILGKVCSTKDSFVLSTGRAQLRKKEVFPELGQVAVKSIIPAGVAPVFDIEVDGNPWFVLADSGCLVHNSDIHKRFLLGNQLTWHIKCNCVDGFIPSDVFPECVAVTPKEVYLRCPRCKMRIHDAQNGRYVAHNPGADYSSYHVSQFISKFITVKEIWDHFQRTVNKKEFYNAKLGRPYVDEENMPVTDDMLENCVNPDLRWLYNEDSRVRKNCAMGVDQHGGNVYVVIIQRGPDGKKRLVHMEVVDQNNPQYWEAGKPISPFKRVHELMREFNVGLCVVDAMPNYNEATDLARAFPARVFVSWYGSEKQKDMVMWSDRLKYKETIKRGSRDIKLKWQCVLNRYNAIDYALSHFAGRELEMPHPDALVQVVRQPDGRYGAENICRTQFWVHMKSIVRQKEVINEQTGTFRMNWVYLGRDPHFVHALTYACIAVERLKRQAVFVM